MNYKVILGENAQDYIEGQDSKTERIIKTKLKSLREEPFPRPNRNAVGDIEKVSVKGEEVYRMHISHSHTAFYWIHKEDKIVDVTDIVDIDTAHKMYD
jgi:mRNA-degrading endonuclease RelE of RelBE toxin-antitoxin system